MKRYMVIGAFALLSVLMVAPGGQAFEPRPAAKGTGGDTILEHDHHRGGRHDGRRGGWGWGGGHRGGTWFSFGFGPPAPRSYYYPRPYYYYPAPRYYYQPTPGYVVPGGTYYHYR